MAVAFSEIACSNTLPGWRLHFAWLQLTQRDHQAALDLASLGTVSVFRKNFADFQFGDSPIVRSVHLLLKRGGLSQAKCSSSFDRLAQRVLDGEGIQTDNPGLAFRDILSLKSMAPWSVIDVSQVRYPLVFRRGDQGEVLNRGEKEGDVEGLPLLCDQERNFWSPSAVVDEDEIPVMCGEVLLVCYAPLEHSREIAAKTHVGNLVHMTKAFRFVMERSFLPTG